MTKKSVAVMIALILFACFLSIIYIFNNGSYVPAFVKSKTSRQVVIDPGHGEIGIFQIKIKSDYK